MKKKKEWFCSFFSFGLKRLYQNILISFWQFSPCRQNMVTNASNNLDEHKFDIDLISRCRIHMSSMVDLFIETKNIIWDI